MPKAKIGLVCNGSMQTGVPDGEGYTISGNTSRSSGGFVAVLTLEDGYVWSDGTYEDKEVAYFISPLAIGGFLTDEQKRKFFPFWSGR